MKQTAVEWLVEELTRQNMFMHLFAKEIEQAKEMHKQEIIDAVNSINVECEHYDEHKWNYENGEQYYQKTFKKDQL